MSTANNHCRDKGLDGLYRTLDVLDEAGLAHVGTYRSQAERDENSGIYVADVGGISVAFLSYTYGLNGFQLSSDTMYAANLFNLDYYTTLSQPNKALMETDLAAARALDTDLIAVMIHWGVEYDAYPQDYQTKIATDCFTAGADLILGAHTHCLQGISYISGKPVFYSLGNFVFGQSIDKTVAVKVQVSSDGTVSYGLLPVYAAGGTTKLMDTNSASTLYQYMTQISDGVTIGADGKIN